MFAITPMKSLMARASMESPAHRSNPCLALDLKAGVSSKALFRYSCSSGFFIEFVASANVSLSARFMTSLNFFPKVSAFVPAVEEFTFLI